MNVYIPQCKYVSTSVRQRLTPRMDKMKATVLICIMCFALSIHARSIVSNDLSHSNDRYSDTDVYNTIVTSDLLKRTKRSFIKNGKCPMYYKPVPNVPFLLCVPCSQYTSNKGTKC